MLTLPNGKPYILIPVKPPRVIHGKPSMSLGDVFEKARNPSPIQYPYTLQNTIFSRDMRPLGFTDETISADIKIPGTPVVLHGLMEQFQEFVTAACLIHYGESLLDPVGEFATITISQKDLLPGQVSAVRGHHMDVDYEDIFGKRCPRDYAIFLCSDIYPTGFIEGGIELEPILDFIRSQAPPESLETDISKQLCHKTYEMIGDQIQEREVRFLAPYEIALYNQFNLHVAQPVPVPVRRTMVAITFYSPFGPTYGIRESNNARLKEYAEYTISGWKGPI